MIKRNLIRTAILCLITGFTLSGCKKEDEPQTPQQTVEFTFGPDYWDEIYPATNVAKAGADKNVGKIKIKSDGKSFAGMYVSHIAGGLDPAFAAANGKGTGDKTILDRVQIDNKSDSIRFADVYGYVFVNCYVPK